MNEFSLNIRSQKKIELIPITTQILDLINSKTIKNGWLHLFVPHTTAAITINEQADPDVATDLESFLARISPDLSHYRHFEGNSPAHALSSLVGVSLMMTVREGQLNLGRWQGLFFCEFDGPRNRTVLVTYQL